MHLRKFLLLGISLIAVSIITAKTPLFISNQPQDEMDAWVDSVYNSMTPEQRVGQLIAQSFQSKDVNAAKRQIKSTVEKYHIGWAYFSSGKAEHYAELANYVNSISSTPVAIALDGEWGLSMRMPDTPRFPKNMMLGAVQDDMLIYEYGREMARECKEIGVNVNFAPTADVNSNPLNPVIGTRSFGEDAENVAHKVVAYSRGLEDGGVLSVAKHFPGHGDTEKDSHKTLPIVDRSLASIESIDLVPFQAYTNAGLSGVMVGHLQIPALKTGNNPTSLTPSVVTGLLKQRLGFGGLVFTDALTMQGARKSGNPNGLRAFLAGADVLLEPYNLEKSFNELLDYYNQGGDKQKSIELTCKKVLRYKYALGLNNYKPVNIDGMMERINSRHAQLVLRKLYAAAMTIVKNDGDCLPVKHLENKVSVAVAGEKVDDAKVFTQTCALYTDITTHHLTEHNAESWAEDNDSASALVIGVFNNNGGTKRAIAKAIAKAGKSKVDLVCFIKPYDLADFSEEIAGSAAVIEAYEDHAFAQEYAAQVVFGGSDASGRMPVSVAGVAKVGDGVTVMASRLGYDVPEAVGLDQKLVEQIDSIANLGVKAGAFPGCQVIVARHGKIVVKKSYGYTDNGKDDAVNGNTLYDLASVSKATGTLSGIMKAVDDKKLNINGFLSDYIPQLKGSSKGVLTIRDLLFHETGMPPSLSIYEQMTDPKSYTGALSVGKKSANYKRFAGGAYINNTAHVRSDITSPKRTDEFNVQIGKNLWVGQITMDSVMNMIYNERQRTNHNYVYSCLNFCLLRQAEENVTGVRHDRYVYDNIFHRIGAFRTVYRPLDFFPEKEIAATELDEYFREGYIRGVVHDETAAFSGGIQGNAGLFSNANDLAKLCQMWLFGGMYGGERILSQSTVNTFLTMRSLNSHRGLGFDKPNFKRPSYSSITDAASAEVVGHTGFTGTSFWVDPKEDLIYIFLSNRVCPSRNNPAFSKIGARYNIFDYIYDSIKRNAKQ